MCIHSIVAVRINPVASMRIIKMCLSHITLSVQCVSAELKRRFSDDKQQQSASPQQGCQIVLAVLYSRTLSSISFIRSKKNYLRNVNHKKTTTTTWMYVDLSCLSLVTQCLPQKHWQYHVKCSPHLLSLFTTLTCAWNS